MQEMNLAPTELEILAKEYNLYASEYILQEMTKLRRGDVSLRDFVYMLQQVIHSHGSNKLGGYKPIFSQT